MLGTRQNACQTCFIIILISLHFLQSTEASDSHDVVDIVFIVDGSSHTEENLFRRELMIIPSVIDHLQIKNVNPRFALITYGNHPDLQIELGSITNSKALVGKLWTIRREGGDMSSLCYALKLARIHIFRNLQCCQPKFLVIFTNGRWNLPRFTQSESVKLRQMGVKIMVLAIGERIDRFSARQLTSSSNIIYRPHITLNYITNQWIFNTIVDNIRDVPDIPIQINSTTKSSKRPETTKISTTQSFIRPVNTKESNTKSSVRPISTKESSMRPVSTKEPTTNSFIRPISTKESNAKSSIEPVSTKESNTKSSIRPIRTKEPTTNSFIRPVSTKEPTTKPLKRTENTNGLTTQSFTQSKHTKESETQLLINLEKTTTVASHPLTESKISNISTMPPSVKLTTKQPFVPTLITMGSLMPNLPPCEMSGELVFILDSSLTVDQEDFKQEIQFTLQVLKQIRVDKTMLAVAVLNYGMGVTINLSFQTFQLTEDKDLNQTMSQIPFRSGRSGAGEALSLANRFLFDNKPNPRIKRIVVLFLSAFRGGNPDSVVVSHIMKKSNDIRIVLVGLEGKFDSWVGNAIASSKNATIMVKDFKSLGGFRDRVVSTLCSI